MTILTEEWAQKSFLDDGINLPLERIVDDTSIWIYANTLNFNLGFVHLTMCKFYLIKEP